MTPFFSNSDRSEKDKLEEKSANETKPATSSAAPPLQEQAEPQKNNDRDAGVEHRNGNHHKPAQEKQG